MDWRLFASTFALIFMAELGDKTQLAAMAATTAGERATWTVFFAASLALVLSTLLAVLFGEALQRVIPPSVIQTVAGILFLIFGVVMLYMARRPAEAAEGVAPAPEVRVAAPEKRTLLARLALQAAAAFESAAGEDYDRLADEAATPVQKALFHRLAEEERLHAQRIGHLLDAHGEEPLGASPPPEPSRPVSAPPASPAEQDAFAAWIQKAIRHERQAAAFYRELAHNAVLPDLRAAFARLAEDEEDHAARLESLVSA